LPSHVGFAYAPQAVQSVEVFLLKYSIEMFYLLGHILLATCFLLVSCLAFSSTQKRRLTFNGLDGVTSQKTELSITIAMRTSNPEYCITFHIHSVLHVSPITANR
jgi:hypothetical protein